MVATRKKLNAAPAKKAAKAPAKKAVKKTVKKAAAKKGAAKKAAPKPAAKKTAAAKPAVKKAAPKKSVKTATKAPVKKTAPKSPAKGQAAKSTPPSPAPVSLASLKGLRGVSGAKAARIAQIVAESFLPKPSAARPAPEPGSAPVSTPAVSVPAAEAGSALDAAHKAAAVLFSKKAEDVVLMDLRGLSTVADYYLIATCQNEPQMRSILGTVQRALSREGIKSLRSEYMSGVRWAVVDYGDMILHLFEKQTRGYYSLERLWADAPSTVLKAADYALAPDGDQEDADEDGDL
jgi:ribosome-associated protein